jgi:putative acetyltransferase
MSIALQTELVIRPARAADFAGVLALLNPPLARSAALRSPPREEVLAKLAEAPSASELHLLALLSEKVIGRARLRLGGESAQTGELGIAIHADYQGKGFGSALLKAVIEGANHQLGVKRIELKVFRNNLRAIHLYEKFGFVQIGVAPALAFEEEADRLVMARL